MNEHQIKFLHTSDLQLGMTRWFLSTDDALPRYAQDQLEAIDTLGRHAQEHDCAFIVIAGDVFDSNSLSEQTTTRALEALQRLPVPTYLLPGNHDPLTADSIFYRTQHLENIKVIQDAKPIEVAPHVWLVGAPLLSNSPSVDVVDTALSALEPTDDIRIMVGHGQFESRGNAFDPSVIDLRNVEQALEQGVIDYLAMGDTHSAQQIGTTGQIWFSGAPETTDFYDLATGGGENNSGKALLVEVTKSNTADTKVQVEELQVGRWTFEAPRHHINSLEDAQEFAAYLESHKDKARTVVRYTHIGSVDLHTKQFLEQVLQQYDKTFAALYPWDRHMDLQVIPQEDEILELGFSGYVAETLETLQALDTTTSRDAMNLLFRLAGGTKH